MTCGLVRSARRIFEESYLIRLPNTRLNYRNTQCYRYLMDNIEILTSMETTSQPVDTI